MEVNGYRMDSTMGNTESVEAAMCKDSIEIR
jgi:hypothetical protein